MLQKEVPTVTEAHLSLKVVPVNIYGNQATQAAGLEEIVDSVYDQATTFVVFEESIQRYD